MVCCLQWMQRGEIYPKPIKSACNKKQIDRYAHRQTEWLTYRQLYTVITDSQHILKRTIAKIRTFRQSEQHAWVILLLAWPRRVDSPAHTHTYKHIICACQRITTLVNPCCVCSLVADQLIKALMELAWRMSWAGHLWKAAPAESTSYPSGHNRSRGGDSVGHWVSRMKSHTL